MDNTLFTFKNNGVQINNDVVLPDTTFDLNENAFRFIISPKTNFWRLGIRLGKDEDIEFYHPTDRYRFPDFNKYKDLHLAVGEWDNVNWTFPQRLQLAQYNFGNADHLVSRIDTYSEMTTIYWTIQYDVIAKGINIWIDAGDNSESLTLPLNEEYRFFKIFAWADSIQFEIDFFYEMTRRKKQLEINEQHYDFPVMPISGIDRKYLDLVYQMFLKNKEIDSTYSLKELWNDFPTDFNPAAINSLLIGSNNIVTLWGIWHIDKHSKIFQRFDNVIFAIKEILRQSGSLIREISSEQIRALIDDLSDSEIWQVFQLMRSFQNFNRGWSKDDNFRCFITLGDNAIYEQYRTYTGLQKFMSEHLKHFGIMRPKTDIEILNNVDLVDSGNISSFTLTKTPLVRNHRSDFKPVMGLLPLIDDFAGIIDSLPDEKGQMIGIFGKWGRGKTFLLEELWKRLMQNKDMKYIKVEYHAWKYQETPASWAYLYELFAKEYEGDKSGFCNKIQFYCKVIKLNYHRLNVWPLIKIIVSIFATFAIWAFSFYKLDIYYTLIIAPVSTLALLSFLKEVKKEYSTKATDLIKKYVVRHSFKDTLGIQANIQDELITLLKVWLPEKTKKKKKILLVVEDVDRCNEEKIIQIIDALRVMLDDEEISKRLIILAAIDERILKNAIRLKYQSFQPTISSDISTKDKNDYNSISISELVNEYLDKLFISAIKLGNLNALQRSEFVIELLKHQSKKTENSAGLSGSSAANNNLPVPVRPDFEGPSDLAIRDNDFVMLDGDLALEDKDGNLFTQLEKEIYLQNKWEQLNEIEIELFFATINDWATATPRRINIFYYRYLLCKNLLISQYSAIKKTNYWRNRNGICIVMKNLLSFSNNYNADSIYSQRVKIIKQDNNLIRLDEIGIAESVEKSDYLILLEIFEIVIAY